MSYEAWGEPDDSPYEAAIEAGWIDPDDLSKAMSDVMAERDRQMNAEGFTAEHDDQYEDGQLERAAAAYALCDCRRIGRWFINDIWGWSSKWWKPRSHRENLVRAAALLIAAIEKIDRASANVSKGGAV